jgi:UDP-glucose 4-epimerase
MRILVTGGAGFIGSNIVDSLIDDGHELAIIDNLSSGEKKNINSEAKFYKEDLSNIGSIQKVFKKFCPEFVIHCAAQTDVRLSMDDPYYDAQQNIINSINLLEIMREYNVTRITYLSSGGAIYDDEIKYPEEFSRVKPKCPYGVSKFTVEKYLLIYQHSYGFNTRVLRLSNVYGPRNKKGVIRIFTDKIRAGEPLTINGGGQIRDYIHVQDVVNAVRAVMGFTGVYNVGTGKPTSLRTLRHMIYKANGVSQNLLDQTVAYNLGEAMFSCLNADKLKFLHWEPKIELEEGLKLVD